MNRVWIEIELDDNETVNHERAEKLTKLLKKMGSRREFWYDETKKVFCSGSSDAPEFKELVKAGDWFNLDFLGRED